VPGAVTRQTIDPAGGRGQPHAARAAARRYHLSAQWVVAQQVEQLAARVLVNLEDLWLEPGPQHVPGTGPERSNWRRRATHRLEAFTAMPAVNDTLRWLARAQTPSPPRQLRTGDAASSERSS